MNLDSVTDKQQTIVLPNNGLLKNVNLVRANYLDWLRVLIVLTLIPYHTATMLIYGNSPGWINNSISSPVALAFCQILNQFQMPLLFTVAGAATWFSLGSRTGKQYFVERVRRLFVPIVFGMLVINVPIYYLSTMFHNQISQYNNSFFIWYQTYLRTMLFPWQKNWSPGILWFIWYLFIYSIVLLPLLLLLRKHVNNNVWMKIGEFFKKYGMLLLLAIIPILVQLFPPPNFYSNFQFSYFVFFFIFGFLIYSSEQMQRCIDKTGIFALVVGAVCIILVMLLIFPNPSSSVLQSIYWHPLGNKQGTIGYTLYLILRGISCWFSIIGLMFLARRLVDFSNRFLRYISEAVLPFYLIHATFIITIGYYVIPLNIDVLAKFAIIVMSSLMLTLAAFEVLKRFNITRFLIGMRIKQKPVKY